MYVCMYFELLPPMPFSQGSYLVMGVRGARQVTGRVVPVCLRETVATEGPTPDKP